MTMSLDTALQFDVAGGLGLLFELAESFGGQQVSAMIQHVSDVAEANGNVVRTNDVDFWENYLTMLESMKVDFNDQGDNGLVLIVNPDMARRLRENPPTPEQRGRIDAIMAAKREESRASRGRRRLS
jgi:hypothetical protein